MEEYFSANLSSSKNFIRDSCWSSSKRNNSFIWFLLFFLALSFGINFIQSVLKGDGSLEQRIKTSVFETIVDSVSTIRAFYYLPRKVQNFLFNDVEEFQIYLSETDFGRLVIYEIMQSKMDA